MADKKISELDAAAALTGTEVAPLVQSGGNVKATIQQITTAVTGATGTNGETVTTSKPRLDLTQTWNAGGTTFTGLKFNVTDTASAAASLLMDLQVGGVSKIFINKTGQIVGSTNLTTPTIAASAASTNNGFGFRGTVPAIAIGGSSLVEFTSGIRVGSGSGFSWTSSGGADAAADTTIARDAADTLAQRRTTNAQTFRIYNTFTDASNYERGKMEWASNVLRIGTEKAGTGTARALEFQTDGVTRLTITTAGSAVFSADILSGNFIRSSQAHGFQVSGRAGFVSPTTENIRFRNANDDGFGLLQFGGTTSSFPALKRSTTSLQARLADDSAFTNIQGKLTTETAYTAGAPTATGYLVLYDSNGTAYKVPAEAL